MRKPALCAVSLLAAVAAFGSAAALADVVPEPLTLDRAVALALDRNAGYRIAHAGLVVSRARLRESAGSRLPRLTLRDDFAEANPVAELSTPFGALPFSSTTTTNVPLLTLAYSIFDGGRTAARVSEAAAGLAAAEGQERNARMTLVDSTTNAYFELAAALESAAVADRAVDVARAHCDDAQHLFAAGQVAHADVLRADTELAGQRLANLGAHTAVALAQTALDNVIGAPLGDLHLPTDRLDETVPDIALQPLLTAADTNRGDVWAARAAIDAAANAVKEARAARAPHVDVVVADGNVRPAVTPGYRNQFSVGLSAVWTLFDNGATASGIEAAQAGIDQAKWTLEQLRSDAERQVRQAYLSLRDAEARVETSRAYVELADENLRLARVRYKGGVGTLLELQDAEFRSSTAHRELVSARAAVREGVVHLRFTAGLL